MKRFAVLLCLIFVIVSCSKGVKLDTKGGKLSRDEALKLMESSIGSVIVDDNLKYEKIIPSDEGNAIAFLFKKEGTNKKFLRFWEIYGDELTIYMKEKDKNYTIKVASNSVDNNCYGYVFDEPRVSDNGVKVIWDDYSKFGCSHNLELTFKDKESATKFAEAIVALKKKPLKINITPQIINNTTIKDNNDLQPNKCTVDKILKMQEIGLSKEEIKKVCE